MVVYPLSYEVKAKDDGNREGKTKWVNSMHELGVAGNQTVYCNALGGGGDDEWAWPRFRSTVQYLR